MYMTKEERERDDKIIGEKTSRYFVGNYISPNRIGEDIKAFSVYDDSQGYRATAFGLFSSKYGIFVIPSIDINGVQGSGNDYVTDARQINISILGEMQVKPQYEGYNGILGPGAYYYPDAKVLNNINYSEINEVLNYVLQKSGTEEIMPITVDEMYDVVANIRGLVRQEDFTNKKI